MEDIPGTQLLFPEDEDSSKIKNETDEVPTKKTFRRQSKSDMTFEQALIALQTTHTLSTRMICEILKTYRPWVTKYILPKLDKLYLNSGKTGGSSRSSGMNWVYMASQALDNEDLKESAWYKTSDFDSLLHSSLVSCTRQTIRVSATIFMDENARSSFLGHYHIIKEKLEENRKKKYEEKSPELSRERAELELRQNQLYDSYIGKPVMEELRKSVSIDEYGISKRTLTPPVEYNTDWNYSQFKAVHDMKGYGGIDELVYRDLFNNGAVKLVFRFKSSRDDVGEKIFYIYDEGDKRYRLDDGAPEWAVPYTFFMKYKRI